MHTLRVAAGQSLADLSALTGASTGHLSRIENERHVGHLASAALTEKLAAAFDVGVDVITAQRPPITDLCRLLGIAAADLADAAGITPARLDRISRGSESPDPDERARLAARLGVDVAVLANGSPDPVAP